MPLHFDVEKKAHMFCLFALIDFLWWKLGQTSTDWPSKKKNERVTKKYKINKLLENNYFCKFYVLKVLQKDQDTKKQYLKNIKTKI